MSETVRKVAEKANTALHISLVVPTLYRKTALADEVLERLQRYFPGKVAQLVWI